MKKIGILIFFCSIFNFSISTVAAETTVSSGKIYFVDETPVPFADEAKEEILPEIIKTSSQQGFPKTNEQSSSLWIILGGEVLILVILLKRRKEGEQNGAV